jgi:hypothetical protein
MRSLNKDIMKLAVKRRLVGVSVVLYVIALAWPAFSYTEGAGDVRRNFEGLQALNWGWLAALGGMVGMPFGVGAIAWFANPMLCIAWIAGASNSRFTALCASGAALFAAVMFLAMHDLDSSSGASFHNIAVGRGYFAWLASIIVVGYSAARTGEVERRPAIRKKNARYVD